MIATDEQQAAAASTRTRGMAGRGMGKQIIDALRERGAPMTLVELVEALGGAYTRKQLHGVLNACSKPKGVYCDYGHPLRFAVTPFAQPKAVAPLIAPMRPLRNYNLFDNWRLCERDPLETSRSAVFGHRGCA